MSYLIRNPQNKITCYYFIISEACLIRSWFFYIFTQHLLQCGLQKKIEATVNQSADKVAGQDQYELQQKCRFPLSVILSASAPRPGNQSRTINYNIYQSIRKHLVIQLTATSTKRLGFYGQTIIYYAKTRNTLCLTDVTRETTPCVHPVGSETRERGRNESRARLIGYKT